MIFASTINQQKPLFKDMSELYRKDETLCVDNLLSQAKFSSESLKNISEIASNLVLGTRQNRKKAGLFDNFLNQYDLSSSEGIALMCLAEALLRIPDTETVDKLIGDKLSTADWQQQVSRHKSLFENATTWSLLLTGKIYAPLVNNNDGLGTSLKHFLSRNSSKVIRPIILKSMQLMGKQFVTGTTIEDALTHAQTLERKGYRYSYDMLGEAARTNEDAEKYYQSYEHAIAVIGKVSQGLTPITGPGISVKLSALHPRYEYSQRHRILNELTPKLLALAQQAKEQNIGLTVDAEEADRLELSLEIFASVFNHPSLAGWEGLGLAVQAYQKRAPAVIDWLIQLSKGQGRRIMVRLIKGAYWDAEIKQSQMLGLEGYPVFTRKFSTDVSYLACAKKILANNNYFFPQFGTHNAHTVAAILELAGGTRDFEFQCLHGMGQPLYDQLVGQDNLNIPCRIYAPVGSHKDLLGYLVRRLLENGANTSFINRMADKSIPVEKLIENPVARIASLSSIPHPYIPLPQDIFGSERKNSKGLDLSNRNELNKFLKKMASYENITRTAEPIIAGKSHYSQQHAIPIISPSQPDKIVGHVQEATPEDISLVLDKACANQTWAMTSVEERAACLDRAADLLIKETPALAALLCLEAGKQLHDCFSEIREAVDFCRYYAHRARVDLAPKILTGATGELDEYSLHARGTIVCISPWNFPLAIFTGQIVAALVAGNTVIAKPAEQTPLIAAKTIHLLFKAGIPEDALYFLPGRGETVGAKVVTDPRIAGVMFTGSTATARLINQSLANKPGPIVPFVAETGGQNVMIVDSSALAEQVVLDVMQSAFNSAGQRCSALRVLFLQDEIAPHFLNMLKGAMAELQIGDPSQLSTDVGPVIDADALQMLENHALKMSREAELIYQVPLPPELKGYYFAPCVFELTDLKQLPEEVFGPILHIIRYKAQNIDKILAQINETGYGLTLGIHSRINATINYIIDNVSVGNIYVNRNIIGAVVGVQPFGGEGLSGTGPKAGGPQYLPRLCVERAISINTTAAGGNTTLVSLHEDD
ncbi:MAG: bifunctional proline dehydrogenase/L-glutamate gamma-semialdehyde dehydrogenase PutA [Gammaproteobacteria bacterium]|nr:bifunctional proline dehydrogenase/L-glutamate gamma-semialdehyde dehydrogenase PutA [Gammaproteobacteria bacterium]